MYYEYLYTNVGREKVERMDAGGGGRIFPLPWGC
jgi:hypothetical protein